MNEHFRGILIGMLAAIVLTPVLVKYWRGIAPPAKSRVHSELSSEAWRRNQDLLSESIVVTFLLLFVLVGILGFGTALDATMFLVLIGEILGVPTVWILARCSLRGRDAIQEFVSYFELSHGVSFRSWLYVSLPALAAGIASLILVIWR